MYIKLDEKLINRITEITHTDYENIGDLLETDAIEVMLEDLINEYDALKEQYEDFEREVEDNYEYRRETPMSEREFY